MSLILLSLYSTSPTAPCLLYGVPTYVLWWRGWIRNESREKVVLANAYLIVFHILLLWCTLVCCSAVPQLLRPSDKQFIEYAQVGNTVQVAAALLYYPDLINVQDRVSDLWYGDQGCSSSLIWLSSMLAH